MYVGPKQYCSSHLLSSSSWANNQVHRDGLTGENVPGLLLMYMQDRVGLGEGKCHRL